ncbi:MAG: hypothetical protein SPI30_09235 [Prevotella sp.]|nr:hypothetical protein [Prevotella sp.]
MNISKGHIKTLQHSYLYNNGIGNATVACVWRKSPCEISAGGMEDRMAGNVAGVTPENMEDCMAENMTGNMAENMQKNMSNYLVITNNLLTHTFATGVASL